MPLFEYKCDNGHITELLRSIRERNAPCICTECGMDARPAISMVNHTFGWKLSDESHFVKGHPDELVKNI